MAEGKKFCTECGQVNPIENELCDECGKVFASDKSKGESKNTQSNSKSPSNQLSKSNEHSTLAKTKVYITNNQRVVAIGAGVIILLLVFVFFFSGSIEASGSWETTEQEYYLRRERYSASINRNGNVDVTVENSDALNGTIDMSFSIEKDEWESTDTRVAYSLQELKELEITVPNLTYQQERADILSQFSHMGIEFDINEGRNDVTISFDITNHEEDFYGSDLLAIIEFVDENDRDNPYGEPYIVFTGLEGRRELFTK